MNRFAALLTRLDEAPNAEAALANYLRDAPDPDRIAAIALLTGQRPKRVVSAAQLADIAQKTADIPGWLFEESRAVVGDLGETATLIWPRPTAPKDRSLTHWVQDAQRLRTLPKDDCVTAIRTAFDTLASDQRLAVAKLLTGGLRSTVTAPQIARAITRITNIDAATLTYRLSQPWSPDTTRWGDLIRPPDAGATSSPYQQSQPELTRDTVKLGTATDWIAQHHWGGIPVQIILRSGEIHIWSDDGALITDRFPEFTQLIDYLPPGTVMAAEIMAMQGNTPLGTGPLMSRFNRKTVPKTVWATTPATLIAHDLLENEGADIRTTPAQQRQAQLLALVQATPDTAPIQYAQPFSNDGWDQLNDVRIRARQLRANGIRLTPQTGAQVRIWPTDPLTMRTVLLYAQIGPTGSIAEVNLALWNGPDLTPVAKIPMDLPAQDAQQITEWITQNVTQKFGPVRQVPPHHVFDIAFDRVTTSPRHKSGLALHGARMVRWCPDATPTDAQTLTDLKDMLADD